MTFKGNLVEFFGNIHYTDEKLWNIFLFLDFFFIRRHFDKVFLSFVLNGGVDFQGWHFKESWLIFSEIHRHRMINDETNESVLFFLIFFSYFNNLTIFFCALFLIEEMTFKGNLDEFFGNTQTKTASFVDS